MPKFHIWWSVGELLNNFDGSSILSAQYLKIKIAKEYLYDTFHVSFKYINPFKRIFKQFHILRFFHSYLNIF